MKTTDLQKWLNVSGASLSKLKKNGMPVDGKKTEIADWLKSQPLPSRGRRPAWATVVKHPGLKKAKGTKAKAPQAVAA